MGRVVLCLPEGVPGVDPDLDVTAARDVEVAFFWDGTPAGVVGFGEGGWTAVELAAAHGELVERLVLVSTPVPEDAGVLPLEAVAAKTLLLFGAKDPAGGHRQASWWKDRLGARIEMVPGEGRDILERVWPRVLSHLAPRARRT